MKDILLFNSYLGSKSYYEKTISDFCSGSRMVIETSTSPEILAWHASLLKIDYDLVLCSFHDTFVERQFLSWVKQCAPGIPCIAVGYSRDYQAARAAWLAGADDYLHCDDLAHLKAADILAELSARMKLYKNLHIPQNIDSDTECSQSPEIIPDTDPGQSLPASETGMIQKAKAYIHSSFAEHTLSLGSVSKHVSLSEKHFSMLFSRSCHITFSDYVMRCRMEKAKELLSSTDQKVYQIALQVGYNSVEHFGRYFKKYTGQSPERYRG